MEEKIKLAGQEEEHHHHHHHHPEEPGIHVRCHEEALIGSLKGRIETSDFQEAQDALSRAMGELGRRIRDRGGIIGHIKFLLSRPEECCQISLTDTEESCRYFSPDSCRVEGVAIVFLVSAEELKEFMEETLGQVVAFQEK